MVAKDTFVFRHHSYSEKGFGMADSAKHFRVKINNNGMMAFKDEVSLLEAVSFFKVDKSSMSSLREVWAVPGIYILLEPTGRYYVGRSDDLFVRIQKHLTDNRVAKAILFKRSANEQFTHADTEWLEERLFATVSSLPSVSMSNAIVPRGHALDEIRTQVLSVLLENITDIAYSTLLLPYEIKATDEEARTFSLNASTSKIDVIDLIEHGLLHSEERIFPHPTYAYCPIGEIDDKGRLHIEDKEFTYLSSAAKSVTNNEFSNGWKFWHVRRGDSLTSLADLRQQLAQSV